VIEPVRGIRLDELELDRGCQLLDRVAVGRRIRTEIYVSLHDSGLRSGKARLERKEDEKAFHDLPPCRLETTTSILQMNCKAN
jgi:hypothetical protein